MNQLRQIVEALVALVVDAVPKVIVAVVALVALLLIALLIERILRRVLARLPIERLLQRTGTDSMLRRVGVTQPPSVWLPRIIYYLLLLLFTRVAADAYGLVAISSAIGALFAYLPKLIAALLLLVIGGMLSRFAGAAVERAATESGIEFAKPLGSITSAFVIFVVGAMAVGQLEFDTAMVRIVTACLLGGFALAFAFSIGFGSREVTRNILAGFYARKVFTPGDVIEVGGRRGVLRAITSTQTLVAQDDDVVVSLGNSVFLDEVVRR
ncbi:MAG: mechanosensitive ion channel family protein [Gemmatimonadaceae bacterium]|jgi:hypothetical protein|nr:mechanosensitive ion channel family protein [Gemmatimonadaceae bacterium]